jgi:hypothetical protein
MSKTVILACEVGDHPKLDGVLDVLNSLPGSYFSYSRMESLRKVKKDGTGFFITDATGDEFASKANFFESMRAFRIQMDLGDSEYLVFLTSRPIPGGFFNGIDFNGKNIFVDIKNWEQTFLKGTSDIYPIAFHVLISILIAEYFPDEASAQRALHRVDKGCVLDFNGYKEKVDLKLLTARICPDCLAAFLHHNPDPNILAYYRHGFERIREHIVNGEYYKLIAPKPVKVILQKAYSKKLGCRLYFEGVGTLDLDAIHLLVYLNFLRQPKGIRTDQIKNDYFFLLELYQLISPPSGKAKIQTRENTIARLCKLKIEPNGFRIKNSNALSERITHINTELSKLLGFGLQEYYTIAIRDGKKHSLGHPVIFKDETGLIERAALRVLDKKLPLLS